MLFILSLAACGDDAATDSGRADAGNLSDSGGSDGGSFDAGSWSWDAKQRTRAIFRSNTAVTSTTRDGGASMGWCIANRNPAGRCGGWEPGCHFAMPQQ